MKIGSIVECIKNGSIREIISLNTPYTIREILPKGTSLKTNIPDVIANEEISIRLEEVSFILDAIQGINYRINDFPFPMRIFRELMPNMAKDIEEILSKESV